MTRKIRVLAFLVAVLGCAGVSLAHAETADPSVGLKRDAVCTRCHDETETKPVLSIYQTKHGNRADPRAPSCQSCHGESQQHIAGGGGATRPKPDVVFKAGTYAASDAATQVKACIGCHQDGARSNWAGSAHQSKNIPCSSCHSSHAQTDPILMKSTQRQVCFGCHKDQRAQVHKVSTHPIEAGKIGCSDCHNPHGSVTNALLIKNSVNETCYTCHAEKRGPFLWEHSPVVDDCTNCHTPHGSNNAKLLKTRAPWLCQDCHSADHGAAINSGANLPGGNATTVNGLNPIGSQSPRAQTNARACLNCHSQIHGSNHPAGAKFQR